MLPALTVLSIAVVMLVFTTKVKSAIVIVFICDLGEVQERYPTPSGLFTVFSVPSNSNTLTLLVVNITTYLSVTSLLIVAT